MIPSEPELDELINALREDLPSSEDEARARRRLAGAGLMLGAACVTHHVSGHLGLKAATLTSKWAAGYGRCLAWLEGLPVAGSALASGVGATTKGILAATAVGVTIGSVVHFNGEAPPVKLRPPPSQLIAPTMSLPPRAAEPPAETPAPQAAPMPSSPAQRPAPMADTLVKPAETPAPQAAPTPPSPAQRPAPQLHHALPLLQPAARPVEPWSQRSAPPTTDAHPTGKQAPTPQGPDRLAASSPTATALAASPPAGDERPSERVERPGERVERVERVEQTSSSRHAPNTLPQETQLLERALRALHNKDVSLARRWLREHHQRFPQGVLAPERQRLLARLDDQPEN